MEEDIVFQDQVLADQRFAIRDKKVKYWEHLTPGGKGELVGEASYSPRKSCGQNATLQWANSSHPLDKACCLMRVTNLSLQSFYFGDQHWDTTPKFSGPLWHRSSNLWVLSTYCQTGLLWVHHHHHHPWVGGSNQIEHRLILLSPEFLLYKHYLFLLKLGTSGCLALGLRFRSADSSEERQQTQTEASIPFYFVFPSASPMRWIPGIFWWDPSLGMVGWENFGNVCYSRGTGLCCGQHSVSTAQNCWGWGLITSVVWWP